MGLSGKYDFKGIKKLGGAGLRAAIASTPQLAWMLKFGSLLDLFLELLANWLANKGLILLNVGAFYLEGKIDQAALDSAISEGLRRVELGAGKLTPDQIKEIDDAVISAADKALPYNKERSSASTEPFTDSYGGG